MTSSAQQHHQQQHNQQQHQQQHNQQHHQSHLYSSNSQYQTRGSHMNNLTSSHSEDDEEADHDEEEEEDDDEDPELYMDQENQEFEKKSYNNPQNRNGTQSQDDEADRASDSSFSDSVSLSSTPSIPCSDDIDFTLVYALHTFLATVDGQASVVKGDQLTLLDDSNSYWWLIRVLKTQAIGYIPAENIETPYERLARLNKHRNVDLSSATPIDVEAGAASSLAQTRFSRRIPTAGDPVRSRSPQDRRKGPGPPPMIGPGHFSPPPVAPAPGTGKGKNVAFTAPTYFENSGNEWSDDEDESGDELMMSGDDVAEGDWDGEGEFEEGEEGFEDEEEESEEEEEEEDEQLEDTSAPHHRTERAPVADPDSGIKSNQTIDAQRQSEEHLVHDHKQQQRQHQLQQQIQHQVASEQSLTRKTSVDSEETGKAPSGWAKLRLAARASADSLRGGPYNSSKDDSRSSLGKGLSPAQRAQFESIPNKETNPQPQPPALQSSSQVTLNNGLKSGSSLSLDRLAPTSTLHLNPHDITETKRLTLTPDIARDATESGIEAYPLSPSRGDQLTRQRSVSGSSVEGPLSPRWLLAAEPQTRPFAEPLSNSLDGHSQSIHSTDSHNGAVSEESKGAKRTSVKKEELDAKKKKTGGLLSGFFGRKKDKKTKNDSLDDTRSSSLDHDRNQSSSPLSPSSEPSVRSSSSPQQTEGSPTTGFSFGRRVATESEDLFSTDATLRKQQEEAKEVLYRQHGISKELADVKDNTVNNARHTHLLLTTNAPLSHAGLQPSPFSPASPTPATGGVYSPPVRIRPGSLIGSPGIAGLEVPMLNVLRIFAGDNVDCESTFKTVLLSAQTTTQELVMQSLQRFHLPATEEEKSCYYLTVKDVGSGEETKVDDQQTPLKLFEFMNESLGQNGLLLPSVKRSSVGSISSISSNLSLNPAISRLGMNDFSDDSAVKFYINRYIDSTERADGRGPSPASISSRKQERFLAPIQEDGANHEAHHSKLLSGHDSPSSSSIHNEPKSVANGMESSESTDSINTDQRQVALHNLSPTVTTTSPSLRFAMRIRIHPSDLPEGLVLDPHSNAIIPKSVLTERGQRTHLNNNSSHLPSPAYREKVIIFPKNIHVSEAIEHSLEAFGIADGVVDGGDDIDDKLSKRRNSMKIRYGLSMKTLDSPAELSVNLISKVLDAYTVPPTLRQPDRTSKETRRRSQEYNPFVLGTLQDLQPSDPIFSLRRASSHHTSRRDSSRNSTSNGITNALTDELALMNAKKNSSNTPSRISSVSSRAASNHISSKSTFEPSRPIENDSSTHASSLKPAAVLSTTRNSQEGIDVTLQDQTTIRSRRDLGARNQSSAYRYSYIDPAGQELDISELMENEFNAIPSTNFTTNQHSRSQSDADPGQYKPRNSESSIDRSTVHSNRTMSPPTTEDGYASAPESPVSSSARLSPTSFKLLQLQKSDDDTAIEALRSADFTIDSQPTNKNQSKPSSNLQQQDSELTPSQGYSATLQHDLLHSVFGKSQSKIVTPADLHAAKSTNSETLDQRIQRVLSKVKKPSHHSVGPLLTSSKPNLAPSSSNSRLVQSGPAADSKSAPSSNYLLEPQQLKSSSRSNSSTSTLSGTVTAVRAETQLASSGMIPTVEADEAKKDSSIQSLEVVAGSSSDTIFLKSQQKDNRNNNKLGGSSSVNSSRSNSTNDDIPVTPLTATSPTGESSNYTPISSATRGIGVDSRQSMNREGGVPGNGHAIHAGIGSRSWLPFVFPSGPSIIGGSDGSGSGEDGLEILMNMIHHSAATTVAPSNGTNAHRKHLLGSSVGKQKEDEWASEDWLKCICSSNASNPTSDDDHSIGLHPRNVSQSPIDTQPGSNPNDHPHHLHGFDSEQFLPDYCHPLDKSIETKLNRLERDLDILLFDILKLSDSSSS